MYIHSCNIIENDIYCLPLKMVSIHAIASEYIQWYNQIIFITKFCSDFWIVFVHILFVINIYTCIFFIKTILISFLSILVNINLYLFVNILFTNIIFMINFTFLYLPEYCINIHHLLIVFTTIDSVKIIFITIISMRFLQVF